MSWHEINKGEWDLSGIKVAILYQVDTIEKGLQSKPWQNEVLKHKHTLYSVPIFHYLGCFSLGLWITAFALFVCPCVPVFRVSKEKLMPEKHRDLKQSKTSWICLEEAVTWIQRNGGGLSPGARPGRGGCQWAFGGLFLIHRSRQDPWIKKPSLSIGQAPAVKDTGAGYTAIQSVGMEQTLSCWFLRAGTGFWEQSLCVNSSTG